MASTTPHPFIFTLLLLTIYTTLPLPSSSQTTPAAAAPSPSSDACNGIFLTYAYTSGHRIPPVVAAPSDQGYRFESTLTVLNNADRELKSWQVFVGFQHNELLVSADNAVLADGADFPGEVGNGTVFAGFPQTDLKSAIETAGDATQMQVQVKLLGTQFGVAPPRVPMPTNISLANDGFRCPKPTMQGNSTMEVCCVVDDTVKTNISIAEEFLPRQNGDLLIMYDVLNTYGSSYLAKVTIENHNSLGRLDGWRLSWDWEAKEFIKTMRGAYPSVVDASECIFGEQAKYWGELDFATVLSCEPRPTIIDLPLEMMNNTVLGLIPYCCRNGTILPTTMDASKSKSAFQMEVYKMPPNINRSVIVPPQNWAINGTLNPDYKCGAPVRVSPSEFPDSSGVPVNRTAVASWQVVCNITQAKGATPRCCVSYSSYLNDSVIPCKTCACGCPSNTAQTCSTTAPAMLLPPDSLLVPFVNRSIKAKAWADLHHLPNPNPTPCADNCGVSINWHLLSDYSKGWTARVTLFNWDETSFADWFAAVELDKASPGFEKMYSFNATLVETDGVNRTVFMQGLEGLNYLVGEVDGKNPAKDPRVPGKQQSVISFIKKLTPGINVAGKDGFPTKVFFNGEECSLPDIIPSSAYRTSSAILMYHVLLILAAFMFVHL